MATLRDLLGDARLEIRQTARKMMAGAPTTREEERRLQAVMASHHTPLIGNRYQPAGASPVLRDGVARPGRDSVAAPAALDEASTVEGTAVEVAQGSDGKLIKVPKHSTAVAPSAYPTIVKVVASGKTISIDLNGVTVIAGGSNYVKITDDAVQVVYGAGDGVSIVKDEGIHVFTAGGKDCYLQNSAVTHDMSIREIDVCSGGVAKKMLILGSAPY